ncbi:MAG: hypothetical protein KGV43_01215 [Arcobacter sp.]|nr:hypothetical protein [Arcobacter sp.]
MRKILFSLLIISYFLEANISIFHMEKEEDILEKKYNLYQNEKYKLPPNIEEIQKKKEKNFDFGVDLGVDTEKKELNSIELDMGIKF